MKASAISRSALDVEWQRLQVIANNLANASSARAADGGMFQPISGPKTAFSALLSSASAQATASGVQVYGIEPIASNAHRVYDPTDPSADATGFVNYPNVDRAGEMTLIDCLRIERWRNDHPRTRWRGRRRSS